MWLLVLVRTALTAWAGGINQTFRSTIPVWRNELVLVAVVVMPEDLGVWPRGYHPSNLSLSLCQATCSIKHFPEH